MDSTKWIACILRHGFLVGGSRGLCGRQNAKGKKENAAG